jgi:hypothetical protein
MWRTSNAITAFCLLSFLSQINGFTMSQAPLLTRLASWGTNYASQVVDFPSLMSSMVVNEDEVLQRRHSAPSSSSSPTQKPATPAFVLDHVTFDNVDMLSDYKSELMEYVYANSLKRAFSTEE